MIFAFASLFSSISSFSVGLYVLLKNSKDSLNRFFFLSSIVTAAAAFSEFMYRQAESYDRAFFWLKIGCVWHFMIPLVIHFVLIFAEQKQLLRRKFTYVLLYLPAAFFFFFDLTQNSFSGFPEKESWGWSLSTLENYFVYYLFLAWFIPLALASIFLIVKFFFSTNQPEKKTQAKFLFIGYLAIFLVSLATDFLLPLFQIKVPEMGISIFLLYNLIVGYIIFKHRLFVFTPEFIAKNIIQIIPDALLILDHEKKIKMTNSAVQKLFGRAQEKLLGKDIKEILPQKISKKIFTGPLHQKLKEKQALSNIEIFLENKKRQKIPVSLSISLMLTTTKKIRAYILICHDISDSYEANKKIKKAYSELKINQEQLEKTNEFMVGRELKMVELKKEIEELKKNVF